MGGVQSSVATGSVQNTCAEQSPSDVPTSRFAGAVSNTGGLESPTVTRNVWSVVFRESSTAVYVTAITPIGSTAPGSTVDVRVEAPQSSITVGGTQFAIAVHSPGFVTRVRSAGGLTRVGGIPSVTDTEKVIVVDFPWISVAT